MDEERTIRAHATNLVGEATGGDASYLEALSEMDEFGLYDVIDVLRDARVPITRHVKFDLEEIFDGREPRYFVPHETMVERYRANHHPSVNFAEPERGLIPASEGFQEAYTSIERHIQENQQYGVSLEPYRDGEACLVEQSFFYASPEWADRRDVVRTMDNFKCRMCGLKGEELQVHHDDLIYSVFSRHFDRNFDVCRLRTACKSCHEDFHRTHVRGISDFRLAQSSDQVHRSRDWRHAIERLHNALRECRFCFSKSAIAA